MFASNILYVEKYDYMDPRFRLAYEFLRRGDLVQLPVQVIKLSRYVTVQVKEYTSKMPKDAKFETHDKMFDIQFVVSGEELFGIASRPDLEITEPYNKEKDITFYRDPPYYSSVLLRAGDLIVVAPEDAHKPACMVEKPAPVKKIIVKISVDC